MNEFLGEQLPESQREADNIENLQMAFIKTFPNNICLAADEDLEYPFYMMVKDKMLLKVHGTSVITLFEKKPKLVCCQNLVLSSVTGRPMSKVLVPIKEHLFDKVNRIDYRKALKMEEQRLPQKIPEKDVPTAILRFLRTKNHNEIIQKELHGMQSYLETDEHRELILYFFAKDPTREVEQRKEIFSMKLRISDYVEEMSKKKHYLFPISDRTKMQVNQHGEVVDILNSQQYLRFAIKSINYTYKTEIKQIAEELGIPESNYFLRVNKEWFLTIAHFNNKLHARQVFDRISVKCRGFGVGCRIYA